MTEKNADEWTTGEWPQPAPIAPSRRGGPAPVEGPAADKATEEPTGRIAGPTGDA